MPHLPSPTTSAIHTSSSPLPPQASALGVFGVAMAFGWNVVGRVVFSLVLAGMLLMAMAVTAAGAEDVDASGNDACALKCEHWQDDLARKHQCVRECKGFRVGGRHIVGDCTTCERHCRHVVSAYCKRCRERCGGGVSGWETVAGAILEVV